MDFGMANFLVKNIAANGAGPAEQAHLAARIRHAKHNR